MVAIYIDPAVCHTWAGYFIPECYGIAVMVGLSLVAAVSLAFTCRGIALKVAR